MKGNGKSGANGKKNGKRKMNAAQIANQFKPGNNANPLGARAHKKRFVDHLNDYLDDECTHQINGQAVEMPKLRKLACMIADSAMRHAGVGMPRSEMVSHVLNRISPIAKDPPAVVNILTVDHSQNSRTFVLEVQQHAGREAVTNQDVLATIEARIARLESTPHD